MTTILVPGTDAVLEIDEEKLAALGSEVMNDLPDLVPHSGENFGKPTLSGSPAPLIERN